MLVGDARGRYMKLENTSGSVTSENVELTQNMTTQEVDMMDHCHTTFSEGNSKRQAKKQLIIASILCFIFMVGEAVGGYLANSLAVMTDAAHLLSDFASFLISLFSIFVATRPPTKRMSFGFYRAEILGALISIAIIWVITGILTYLAAHRIVHGEYDINADTMIIVSGIGVGMNILMGVILQGSCSHIHSHSHSHTSGHQHNRNINVRAAFIHVLGDLIQSIGVLVSAYIIKYKPEYKIADPICTFIFSALVLFTTFTILRDTLYVLMEGFPTSLSYTTIMDDLKSVPGVMVAHSLHIWSLTLDRHALAVHLAVDRETDSDVVLKQASRLMRLKHRILNTTIQVERYEPDIMDNCCMCRNPER